METATAKNATSVANLGKKTAGKDANVNRVTVAARSVGAEEEEAPMLEKSNRLATGPTRRVVGPERNAAGSE